MRGELAVSAGDGGAGYAVRCPARPETIRQVLAEDGDAVADQEATPIESEQEPDLYGEAWVCPRYGSISKVCKLCLLSKPQLPQTSTALMKSVASAPRVRIVAVAVGEMAYRFCRVSPALPHIGHRFVTSRARNRLMICAYLSAEIAVSICITPCSLPSHPARNGSATVGQYGRTPPTSALRAPAAPPPVLAASPPRHFADSALCLPMAGRAHAPPSDSDESNVS